MAASGLLLINTAAAAAAAAATAFAGLLTPDGDATILASLLKVAL
jgi:hypothetical protein